jgi:aminoglycoside phosphotransferase (APT) family kinase protein
MSPPVRAGSNLVTHDPDPRLRPAAGASRAISLSRRTAVPTRDRVREIVRAALPDQRVTSVVELGEGLDHSAYEVDGELIVRFEKPSGDTAPATLVIREARLLAAVAGVSPIPVPEPLFVLEEEGCLGYRKLPGRPLIDVPEPRRSARAASVARTLGELLTALHAAHVELVGVEDVPLAEWLREAAETYRSVAAEVPVNRRGAVDAFLRSPPPDGRWTPVFSHNDLGIEHVLVDPPTGRVTGVIDWSDAAIVDPAYDFGLLHRDLGPAALEAALRSYRTERGDLASVRDRAVFYARCTLFGDLAYGLEAGNAAYIDKSVAALDWLFAS